MNARISPPRRISRHLTPYRLLEPSQGGSGTVRVFEDGGTRDEHGGAGRHDACRVVGLDPAVHLELRGEVSCVERLADSFDLPERALDELLPAKAGMNAH